jgi:hypothetical protein
VLRSALRSTISVKAPLNVAIFPTLLIRQPTTKNEIQNSDAQPQSCRNSKAKFWFPWTASNSRTRHSIADRIRNLIASRPSPYQDCADQGPMGYGGDELGGGAKEWTGGSLEIARRESTMMVEQDH